MLLTKNQYTESYVMDKVDELAAAASSFNAHTYDQFIRAREELKRIFKEIFLKSEG